MDAYAFRIANRLVGNATNAPALELTVTGPTLRFNVDSVIALTGATMKAELDGKPVDYWMAIAAPAGSVLKLRSIQGAGQRTYLAVQGGFDVPLYMNSAATFTLGQFGGHAGRALRVGDTLRLSRNISDAPTLTLPRRPGEGIEIQVPSPAKRGPLQRVHAPAAFELPVHQSLGWGHLSRRWW